MFGSVILEVAIGIMFVFLLVSIMVSTIREGIESWLKTRAAYLEHGIRELLHDLKGDKLAANVYAHPLIASLYPGYYKPGKARARPAHFSRGGELPSYIPAKNFALALMDIAARGAPTDEVSSHPQSPAISLDSVRANIQNIGNPHVQRALLTALDTAQGQISIAQKNIEQWFDSSMDRVSGWYRRTTQWMLFWIGLAVAIAFNVNTLWIAHHLYTNDAARRGLVAIAESAQKDTNLVNSSYREAVKKLDAIQLPVGWSDSALPWKGDEGVTVWTALLLPLLGWLMTAIAATMGAPFWFDLLNKIMVIRSTVKPHEKSPEERSEDRQPRTQPAIAPIVPVPIQSAGMQPTGAGVQQQVSAVASTIPNTRDVDSMVDACGHEYDDLTADEDLPASRGGVQ